LALKGFRAEVNVSEHSAPGVDLPGAFMNRRVALLFLLLSACGGTAATCPVSVTDGGTTDYPERWSTNMQAVFQTNCGGCHPANYAFASSPSALDAINAGSMPRGGSLSTSDLHLVQQWAACGSPQ
jgi:hypothetical protein